MDVVHPVQVTVHVSDSEDEDEEEIFDEEGGDGDGGEGGGGGGRGGDPESGGKGYPVDNGPPTSCIVPIYRYVELYIFRIVKK